MKGNPSDRTTLPGFLKKIEETYGRAQRIWVMDRGLPTEEQRTGTADVLLGGHAPRQDQAT